MSGVVPANGWAAMPPSAAANHAPARVGPPLVSRIHTLRIRATLLASSSSTTVVVLTEYPYELL